MLILASALNAGITQLLFLIRSSQLETRVVASVLHGALEDTNQLSQIRMP